MIAQLLNGRISHAKFNSSTASHPPSLNPESTPEGIIDLYTVIPKCNTIHEYLHLTTLSTNIRYLMIVMNIINLEGGGLSPQRPLPTARHELLELFTLSNHAQTTLDWLRRESKKLIDLALRLSCHVHTIHNTKLLYTYKHTRMHAPTHKHMHLHKHTHMHLYTSTHTHTCTHTNTHTCTYTNTHTCTYTSTHTCTHTRPFETESIRTNCSR